MRHRSAHHMRNDDGKELHLGNRRRIERGDRWRGDKSEFVSHGKNVRRGQDVAGRVA